MSDAKEQSHDQNAETEITDIEDGVNERALLRKLDWRLLPAVGVLYLLSFLDRSNVGNARIEGMVSDLHMTGNQYLTGLTVYFIGYVLFEIPCNVILKKTSPRLWLPTLTIAWGVTESGLFPGVVFYLSMCAASLAGAFGGILAYGIGKMAGVVWSNGWRWIFILEGIATVIVATIAYWFIENYPDTAKFLTKPEREFIQTRLAADCDAMIKEEFTWSAVLEAVRDPNCWLYSLGFHTMSLPLYTLSLFLPTIISNLGYTAAKAQLLTIPPYALAFVTTVVVAIASEKLGKRAVFLAGSSLTAAIGYIILLANTDPVARPGVSYLGTFFAAAGIYPSTALVLSWPAINVSGQTKRAIANAMQISIGNLGAVMGTQLYRSNDGPRFVVGHSMALAYLCANAIVATYIGWRLRAQNKAREEIAPEIQNVGEALDWQGDKDPRWRFSS
ncbi:major facilitator superfamily domain-containing protein [Trichoderma breve]|uniref:Major facilitator superfamily domain-containing protein n=1 Tax=Trichoderma breve TaxID=2034170 RepID=A0A9W9BGI8_9HYPO|nr:major facilitator superfamily domain-containing protein [Trichoderma breve]KAJ4859396.1 major facilitator superfamily domain-containing protein [Trichoderma breve]